MLFYAVLPIFLRYYAFFFKQFYEARKHGNALSVFEGCFLEISFVVGSCWCLAFAKLLCISRCFLHVFCLSEERNEVSTATAKRGWCLLGLQGYVN
jgi:hypothetical protein